MLVLRCVVVMPCRSMKRVYIIIYYRTTKGIINYINYLENPHITCLLTTYLNLLTTLLRNVDLHVSASIYHDEGLRFSCVRSATFQSLLIVQYPDRSHSLHQRGLFYFCRREGLYYLLLNPGEYISPMGLELFDFFPMYIISLEHSGDGGPFRSGDCSQLTMI